MQGATTNQAGRSNMAGRAKGAARIIAGLAPVAQLDRAPPSGGGSQRFESSRARHYAERDPRGPFLRNGVLENPMRTFALAEARACRPMPRHIHRPCQSAEPSRRQRRSQSSPSAIPRGVRRHEVALRETPAHGLGHAITRHRIPPFVVGASRPLRSLEESSESHAKTLPSACQGPLRMQRDKVDSGPVLSPVTHASSGARLSWVLPRFYPSA